jgi:hypothetical protein
MKREPGGNGEIMVSKEQLKSAVVISSSGCRQGAYTVLRDGELKQQGGCHEITSFLR